MGSDDHSRAGRSLTVLVVGSIAVALCVGDRIDAQGRPAAASVLAAPALTATSHPPLPGRLSLYWLVPDPSAPHTTTNPTLSKGAAQFARGATLVADGKFAAGLPLVTGAALAGTPLAPYGR